MPTPDYTATARPFRETRLRYLAELAQARDDVAACESARVAPAPTVDAPTLADIERAKARDAISGTSDAAPLIEVATAAQAAHREAKNAAALAAAQLPALRARIDVLGDLEAESRRQELQALSAAALQDIEGARAAYRQAADALADRLAELLAVYAVLGAEQRHRVQADIGQHDLTPFGLPAAVLSLPSLEALGSELDAYAPGSTGALVTVDAELRQRAGRVLATILGESL